jgi:hypothetical protein
LLLTPIWKQKGDRAVVSLGGRWARAILAVVVAKIVRELWKEGGME